MKPFFNAIIILSLMFPRMLRAGNGIRFIENKGQWTAPFLYKAKLMGGALFVEKNAFTYNFYNADKYKFHRFLKKGKTEGLMFHAFKISFLNANVNCTINADHTFPEYYNYFLGKDKRKWQSNVKSFQLIAYKNLYPNIDMNLYSLGNQLKYDIILNTNAIVDNIKFNYKGVKKLFIDRKGNLHIKTSVNEIIEQRPYAYQVIKGNKKEIPCQFVLNNNVLSFKLLKNYNKKIPLVIDPILVFASYSGSTADNFGMTATYGYDGSLFAGGTAFNVGYPTTLGAFDPSFNGVPAAGITDIVITRYDSTGTNLIYSTYIGGTQAETVHSIIADKNNELYLYGVTSSTDFPINSASYDSTFNGGSYLSFPNNGTTFNNGTDIYVAKLNALGTSLLGSTYIGGSANDGVNHKAILTGSASLDYDSLMNNYGDQYRGEIMLDGQGNCYITSSTKSADFPTLNAFDTTLGGNQDAVVFKLNSNLTSLYWSTYLGGINADAGYSLKVDTNHYVYIAGGTASANFPVTTGTINTTYQGGIADGYIAKIDSNGSAILAATFLGTNNYDQCYFVDIDRFGSVYTVGQTKGIFPVINAAYSNPNSGQFIVRMNNNLTNIDYSTVFGNGNVNAEFSPSAFLVDKCENVYVSGWGGNILGGSPLTGMPISANAFQPSVGDGFNFYLFVLERNAQSLLYGTYFGGNQSHEHVDGGTSRFDKNGIVYQSVCAGCWGNSDFPTTAGAWSNTNNSSGCNNGIFKFDFEIVPKAKFSADIIQGCAPLTVTFTNTSNTSDTYLWDFGGGDTTSQIFNPVKTYTNPGTYQVTLLITDSICNTVDTAFQIITVSNTLLSASNDTILCDLLDTINLLATSYGTSNNFVWSSNSSFTDTLNTSVLDSNLIVAPNVTTSYYVEVINGVCTRTDTVNVKVIGQNSISSPASICLGDTISLSYTNTSPGDSVFLDWSPNSQIIAGDNTPTITVSPTTTTVYTIIAVNDICIDTLYQTVTVNNAQLIASNDTVLCSDSTTITLMANSFGTSSYFIWSSNSSFTDTLNTVVTDSILTITPTTPATYYVLINNNGCIAIDSVVVGLVNAQTSVANASICYGDSVQLTITNLNPSDSLTYDWSPNNQIISGDSSNSILVSPTSNTTFYVTSTNRSGCIIKDTIYVTVDSLTALNINVFADNTSIYNGDSTQLHVTPSGYTYLWLPNGIENNTSQNPIVYPTITTTYTVLLTSANGCVRTGNVTINVLEIKCGEPDIYLPNAFTPNKDGENDILFIRGNTIKEVELKIYDRWGEKVFETTKQVIGWDGTYKGKLVEPGVFVYYLKITCVDDQEYFKKGNITVIR